MQITRLLHSESIGLSMLCAVIFAARIGGFGPALFALALSVLSFHYYLVPPVNECQCNPEHGGDTLGGCARDRYSHPDHLHDGSWR
jgi:K+-sensing histidine kinase KdpD